MNYRLEYRQKGSGKGAVRLVFTIDGERSTVGLGIVLHVSEWDGAKTFARKDSAAWPRLIALRAALENAEVKAISQQRSITKAEVMAMVGRADGTGKANGDTWAWLTERANGYKEESRGVYVSALVSYRRHCTNNGTTATPSQATLSKWNATMNKGVPGTAQTYLSTVKSMLVAAKQDGIIEWTPIVDLPTVPAKRGKIALTDAQVKALERLKVKGELLHVRDLFLLGTYTSQRRSDWNIATHDLGTVKTNKKTGGTALIVDPPWLSKLLAKYGGRLSYDEYRPALSAINRRKRFDADLRKVMRQLAGVCPELNELILHRGRMVPGWRATGSHSARKTFISKYAQELPLPVVMRATGHKSLAQFAAYVQNTVDDRTTAKLFR